MKSFRYSFLITLFAIVAMFGCSKEEEPVPDTTLEMTVTDELGNIVTGANVKLFTSQTDWLKKTNQFSATQTTDANGKVIFKGLQGIQYFWSVEKDCQNNLFGAISKTTPLTANKANTATVVLSGTGILTFTNTSSDPYQVFINGQLLFTAEGKKSYPFTAKTGAYTIRVLQVSGYAFEPTDKSYSSTLACGANVTLQFPN
jgi:hypothetical protein